MVPNSDTKTLCQCVEVSILTKAVEVLCFSATVFSTGFSNTIGSVALSGKKLAGLSGDPNGE